MEMSELHNSTKGETEHNLKKKKASARACAYFSLKLEFASKKSYTLGSFYHREYGSNRAKTTTLCS